MQERAARTRRAILNAAAETFEARGYFGANLQDIVTQMGISKGALYFHFGSKETLADAIVHEHNNIWYSAITDLQAKYPRAIRVILEVSWRIAEKCHNDALMRAGVRLLAERDLAFPTSQRPFANLVGTCEELLAKTRAQGDLLPDVDVSKTASFVATALSGLMQAAKRCEPLAQGGVELPQCVTTMWRYVLPGLVTADCLADMSAIFGELSRAS